MTGSPPLSLSTILSLLSNTDYEGRLRIKQIPFGLGIPRYIRSYRFIYAYNIFKINTDVLFVTITLLDLDIVSSSYHSHVAEC